MCVLFLCVVIMTPATFYDQAYDFSARITPDLERKRTCRRRCLIIVLKGKLQEVNVRRRSSPVYLVSAPGNALPQVRNHRSFSTEWPHLLNCGEQSLDLLARLYTYASLDFLKPV